jgi:hypothetical protein
MELDARSRSAQVARPSNSADVASATFVEGQSTTKGGNVLPQRIEMMGALKDPRPNKGFMLKRQTLSTNRR